jgi:hypothetical protein
MLSVPTASAGILEQSMGAKNQVAIGLSYRPARLHRLAESIPGLLKSLKISSQDIKDLVNPVHNPDPRFWRPKSEQKYR